MKAKTDERYDATLLGSAAHEPPNIQHQQWKATCHKGSTCPIQFHN